MAWLLIDGRSPRNSAVRANRLNRFWAIRFEPKPLSSSCSRLSCNAARVAFGLRFDEAANALLQFVLLLCFFSRKRNVWL